MIGPRKKIRRELPLNLIGPKNKVTQVTGAVFQGFEDDQLLTAKRPELIEGKKGASKEKN